MSAFCDSSALVKLYADEAGADAVRGVTAITISALARVEVPAALWRKHRSGGLSADEVAALVDEFESDYYERFALVAVETSVLAAAARAVARSPLRAYDAVQLACAQVAREADPEVNLFATFDNDLARAAAAEGFGLLG